MNPGIVAGKDLGYQQITALSAAASLTVPAGTKQVLVVAETQAVRWRADGTNPSATVGMPLAVGTLMTFEIASIAQLKFFEQAASAKLNVYYLG